MENNLEIPREKTKNFVKKVSLERILNSYTYNQPNEIPKVRVFHENIFTKHLEQENNMGNVLGEKFAKAGMRKEEGVAVIMGALAEAERITKSGTKPGRSPRKDTASQAHLSPP